MRRISAVIIALLFPFLLGTTYIVRENGKEVGKWSESDGSDVVRYIDNSIAEKSSLGVMGKTATQIEEQSSARISPFSFDEEFVLNRFFRLNDKPLHVARSVDFGMKKDILKITTLGSKFNWNFCRISRMMGSGMGESECVPQHLQFKYAKWSQDNPVEASDCYDLGRRFGNLSYEQVEDRVVSLLLSETDYKEWKDGEEKRKLNQRIDVLQTQVADIASKVQY